MGFRLTMWNVNTKLNHLIFKLNKFQINYVECKCSSKHNDTFKHACFRLTMWNVNVMNNT